MGLHITVHRELRTDNFTVNELWKTAMKTRKCNLKPKNIRNGKRLAMERKIKFENRVISSVDEVYETQQGRMNEMMRPEHVRTDFENGEIALAFPILEWELNRVDVLHGGITGAMFDFTFGVLVRSWLDLNFAPTIDLETTYIKSVPADEKLIIVGRIVSSGRNITHLYGEAFLEKSGMLAASAKASFFNTNTKQSKK